MPTVPVVDLARRAAALEPELSAAIAEVLAVEPSAPVQAWLNVDSQCLMKMRVLLRVLSCVPAGMHRSTRARSAVPAAAAATHPQRRGLGALAAQDQDQRGAHLGLAFRETLVLFGDSLTQYVKESL